MQTEAVGNFRVYLIALLPLWFFAPIAFIAGWRMHLIDIQSDRTMGFLVAASLLLSALIGLLDFDYLRRNRVAIAGATWLANLVAPVGYFFLRAFATAKATGVGFGCAVLATMIWGASVLADVLIDGTIEDWISVYTLEDVALKSAFMLGWTLLVALVFAIAERVIGAARRR